MASRADLGELENIRVAI